MKRLILTCLTLSLAACGGGASNILGGGATKAPTAADLVAAPPADPKTRAVQVAWNVSRANKCGFNLDAATLKSTYLAYESSQGASPESLLSLEKAYEFSRGETAGRIAVTDNYCNEKRLTETRADLARYLAGDFAARQVKKKSAVPQGGFFDAFDTGVEAKKVTLEDALKPKE